MSISEGARPETRAAQPLALGRVIWVVAVGTALVLFAVGLPARLAELDSAVAAFSPAQQAVLTNLGVEPDGYPFVALGIDMVVTCAFLAVSALICWRRSDDWVAIYVSVAAIGLVLWISPTIDALLATDSAWRTASNAAQAVGWGATMGLLYVFPDGRLVPRWASPMIVVLALVTGAWILAPASGFNLADRFRLPPSSFALLLGIVFAGIAAQIYRLFRAAGPVQRLQTKWVVFGIALQVSAFAIFGVVRLASQLQPDAMTMMAAVELIGAPVTLLFSVFIPLAYLVSILRYRLWDIDFLINHAFVYGTLTAILSGLYVASIGFSQRLFVALTGNRSEAAIVISTLIVAAAFTPVRGRLQGTADRYFKEASDPLRRVKAFRDDVRSLVELVDPELITARALREAVEAFGATEGSVYLRRAGRLELVAGSGVGTEGVMVSLPLRAQDQELGIIELGPRQSGRPYTGRDHEILEDLARQVAAAIALVGAPRSERTTAGPVT